MKLNNDMPKTILLLFLLAVTPLKIAYAYDASAIGDIPGSLIAIDLIDENATAKAIKVLKNRGERIKLANNLIKQLDALDEFLPQLSANEINMLEKQRDSFIDSKNNKDIKIIEARSTEMFSNNNLILWGIKGIIAETLSTLNCAKTSSNTAIEMYCWTKLSAQYTSVIWSNDINTLIIQGRVLNIKLNPLGDTTLKDLGKIYSIEGNTILEYIVLPYLAENIRQSS